MSVIVESNILSIIGIDPSECDDGTSKIAGNIFDNSIDIARIGFGIDIEAIFVLVVNLCFDLFERRADLLFQKIEKGGLERFSEEKVIEVLNIAPKPVIRKTAFGDEAVNMWIPFQRTSKRMEDANEAGSEPFGLVLGMKHTDDDTADCLKKAVEKRTIFQEKMPKLFIDSKNAMSMSAGDQLESHTVGSLLGIFDATGRAEPTFAAERNKFHISAMGTDIHGSTKRRIPTMDHFVHVFHYNGTWM